MTRFMAIKKVQAPYKNEGQQPQDLDLVLRPRGKCIRIKMRPLRASRRR
jgi:hypothetical protein